MPNQPSELSQAELRPVLARFAGSRVLVVGDVILDHYFHGHVTRISPEAPVPVMAVDRESYLLGGAANVARNIAALGAKADLIGLRGKDESGRKLAQLLRKSRGVSGCMVVDETRPTTLKSRCVAHGQQMLRLDRERTDAASGDVARRLLAEITRCLPEAHAVIISDYAKGVLSTEVLEGLLSRARKLRKPVFVDPKGHDYTRYHGATYITPNQKEAQEASGIAIADDASLAASARKLLRDVDAEAVFITRGAKGVGIFPRRGKPHFMPARAREVFDVTGAGDTFIAVSALSVVAGGSLVQAAAIANAAAGVSVGYAGVATVSRKALEAALVPQEESDS